MIWKSRELLDSAAGKPCANCGRRDGTTVAAHSNDLRHGRGAYFKTADILTARLCAPCHDFVDGRRNDEPTGLWGPTREDRREVWRRGFEATVVALALEGWIRPPGRP